MDSPRRSTSDMPRWYVRLWSSVAGVILVCGTLVPVMSYGVWRVATVFLFVSAIVGGCGLTWSLAIGFSWRKAVGTGLGCGGFLTTSWGLVEVFGPWSLGVPAAVAVLAPSTIRTGRRALASRGRGATPAGEVSTGTTPLVADHDLQRLTLQELCGFWRRSEVELDSDPDVTRALRLVRQRAVCLAEMELRQPDAFAQWLTTDPLTTDPRSFLQPSGQPPYGEAD
ncbi:MAG TPA: hypothetical protein VMT27_06405 [Actinomycetes bacterium]|nr:hypothetical protein [Actinomycetes bacterium]